MLSSVLETGHLNGLTRSKGDNMIPKEVRVNMTPAQVQQYLYQYSLFRSQDERKQRLDISKKCNVSITVTKSARKCYVMDRLVVSLPRSRAFAQEFSAAVRTVLNTLIAVNDAIEY